MIRERLVAVRERVQSGIDRAFEREHTPHEIAASFAFGAFVAALPTGGLGWILFILLAAFVDRVSKIGLLAAIVVFNPPVKWSVYAASFWLGSRLLGPVPGVTFSDIEVADITFSAGGDVVLRQLLGNVILAITFATVGYVVVLLVVREYRRRDFESVELVSDSSESADSSDPSE